MASNMKGAVLALVVLVILAQHGVGEAQAGSGHATFYGGSDASGTNNGACGYTNLWSLGYGSMTCALSNALFNDGLACGGCYRLSCAGANGCNGNSITVTATNNCPQGSYGGWCDYPKEHFDLSQPAFATFANTQVGFVAVSYQKVACSRSGGIRFLITGHTYWFSVLVYNVAGAGDVNAVSVKGTNTNWISLTRSWGQIYTSGVVLDGQALAFKVTTSDGASSYSYNAAPQNWNYGQTFSGSQF